MEPILFEHEAKAFRQRVSNSRSPPSMACLLDADCFAAVSLGFDTEKGTCIVPRLSACAAGEVLEAAVARSVCGSDGGGMNDGTCILRGDRTGDVAADSIRVCLENRVPNGGRGSCTTSGVVSEEFAEGVSLSWCTAAEQVAFPWPLPW